ncbi:hypothetical protein BJY01DRAFT_204712 [Aspergillus pseudoustus]|uniref:UBC core domain-containing protein n=1 Tax=Aspergillus pseudoustus TaxID=1810923 RepID=A0ABR4KRS2_9EURO
MDSESSITTSHVRQGNDEKFDLGDACCLNSDPSRVGYVFRTPYDVDEYEPLAGLPIFRLTNVPENDLMSFMATGVPPKGYVFVWFYPHGYSLVREDDLKLIDRPFMLGMGIKRHSDDTITGMIISSTSKCTLEPIVFQPVDPMSGEYYPLKFTQKLFGDRDDFLTPEDPGDTAVSPSLLLDIPHTELTGYEEFAEDDFIVYRQKLGVIREIEHDAVLLLPDSTVVSPLSPTALELPLCADTQVAISMPETKGRELENGRYVRTMYTEDIQPGQSVLIDPSNLCRSQLSSQYQGKSIQAYILSTPIEGLHIDWLCPNVFSSKVQECGPSSEVLRLSTLQGHAVKCNFARSPGQHSPSLGYEAVPAIGERVRFCDPVDAAAKYPGYRHLPPHQTFGHDLNIFRIASTKTEVMVRWQDGSCTMETTISLRRFDAPEDHLWPGKYVALKDGIRTTNESAPSPTRGHLRETLYVPKVGVIQAVDNLEQIASVRWFRNSGIELTHGGSTLNPCSSLGQLEDLITKVSVYELATFPALNKSLNDLVILAPASVDHSAMSPAPVQEGAGRTKYSPPGTFSSYANYLQSIKSAMVESEWFKRTTTIRPPPLRRRYSIQNDEQAPYLDFTGKIVAMDPNGEITVRLPGHRNCNDIQVPLERIMMVISSDGLISTSQYNDNSDESSTGSEWDTEDESAGSVDSDELTVPHRPTEIGISKQSELIMTGVSGITPDSPRLSCERLPIVGELSTPIIRFPMPTCCPPNFTVLEGLPPSDHYFISRNHSESSAPRMKRIQKEFEVLKTALPSGIFVRTWESRMDLLRVMMIGPEGTPYEHSPFVIDLGFTPNFPSQPPLAFFQSWTDGQGRINPNLYEDGKICLSILGTWPTQNPEETWIPGRSTVLQILVSIMGLVLVKAPFYNEAGYEALAADDNKRVESSQYTEKAFLMTRRFILHALERPVRGLEDVLMWHYLPDPSSTRPHLLCRAIKEALEMIDHQSRTASDGSCHEAGASVFLPRLSLGAVVMLKKHVAALQKVQMDIQTSKCL